MISKIFLAGILFVLIFIISLFNTIFIENYNKELLTVGAFCGYIGIGLCVLGAILQNKQKSAEEEIDKAIEEIGT